MIETNENTYYVKIVQSNGITMPDEEETDFEERDHLYFFKDSKSTKKFFNDMVDLAKQQCLVYPNNIWQLEAGKLKPGTLDRLARAGNLFLFRSWNVEEIFKNYELYLNACNKVHIEYRNNKPIK